MFSRLAVRPVLVSDTAAIRATLGEYPAIFVERHPTSIAQALRQLARDRTGSAEFEAASLSRDRFSCERFDRRAIAVGVIYRLSH